MDIDFDELLIFGLYLWTLATLRGSKPQELDSLNGVDRLMVPTFGLYL